jgi:hypothetical protein
VKVWISLLLALLTVACGGSSTSPTPVTPPVTPTPTLATITGHVTATNGGQSLGGLTVALAGHPGTTDGAGTFAVQTTPAATAVLLLTGSGIVPRSVTLAATGSHDVALGAIALGGTFDLTFYRQLVRNGFEGGNEPLRRWTRNLNLFLQTGTTDATLTMVESVVRDAAPRWTAGAVNVQSVERGPGTREGQAGWLTVKWAPVNDGHCGISQVGQEGGWIELHPNTPGCACNGWTMRPTTVRHELGHALGFWHTDNPSDLMFVSSSQCDTPISARELTHAAIAYARPVGNQDPDSDPISVVTLASRTVR